MEKEIKIGEKSFRYNHKISPNASRMRLAVFCDGTCQVTTPRFLSQNFIDKFLVEKFDWIINKIEHFKKAGIKILSSSGSNNYKNLKNSALTLAENRISYFNKYYNFDINRISVKNQKSRWGSCSQKKNLNFNYKIALLPAHLADYIIVHELCHLNQMNHSKNFWNLVGEALPNHKELRKEINKFKI